MPCPHCGCEIEMLWRTAAADGTETYRLQWDGDPGVDGPGFDVRYVCQECDAPIREHHKTAMLAAGHWVHTHPERRTRGYKINALAAPIGSVSWRILAAEWAKATALAKAGDTSALRVFVNTRLAEPWEDVIGETIDVRALLGRRENWGNTRETPLVPARATVLTSGVDVQGGTGRIECAVWAWGPTTERWLVGYYVLPGSAYDPGTWDSLDEIRLRDFPRVGGGTMRIAAMAVDSGFATDEVHRWTHPRRAAGVFAVKGLGGTGLLIYNPKAQRSEKRGRYRGTFHSVSTNATGDEWHSHLLIPPAEPPEAHKPGYVHLPDWVDEAWIAGFTAERRVQRRTKGRATLEWECPEHHPNEPTDTARYALAALHRWLIKGHSLGAAPAPAAPPPAPVVPPPRRLADEQQLSSPNWPHNDREAVRAKPSGGPVRPYGGRLSGRPYR